MAKLVCVLLSALCVALALSTTTEFDVVFQHRTYLPSALLSSHGRLTLGTGGKAYMKWADVSRQSVVIDAARNKTHAFGVDFASRTTTIYAVDFTNAKLSAVCNQPNPRNFPIPMQLWGDGSYGSRYSHQPNNSLFYQFGKVDLDQCAFVPESLSDLTVTSIYDYRFYNILYVPELQSFFWLGMLLQPKVNNGILITHTLKNRTSPLTDLNLTCTGWRAQTNRWLSIHYSSIDASLYVVSENIYTTTVHRLPLRSDKCELIAQFNPANAEIRAVSYDDLSGTVFFDDGYQGFGVMNVRTRKSYAGTFGWFYNTNSLYSSAINPIN